MRIRATEPEDRESLQLVGTQEDEARDGVVFVAARELADWPAVEEELAEAFRLAQEASVAGSPVVFVVDSDAMLGRAGPLDSMVATSLVAGARTLAFEGLRKERYVGIIATDRSHAPRALGEAVRFAVANRAGHGQVITLGTRHAGAMFP